MKVWNAQLLLFSVFGFYGFTTGDFYVASHPKGMEFVSKDAVIKRRELPGIINFLMGLPAYNLHRTESWPGLMSIDPFNPPKVNLLITLHVPEGNEFLLTKYAVKYATDNFESRISPVYELNSALIDEYYKTDLVQSFGLPNQFQGTSFDEVDVGKIRERLNGEDSVVNGLPFKTESLIIENDIDIHFFGEIQLLQDIVGKLNTAKLSEKQSVHVLLTSIDILAQEYGPSSPQVKEAIKLFEYYIPELIEAAEDKFQGGLLCDVDIIGHTPVVSDYLIRHSRSLLQAAPQPDVSDGSANFTQLNLAEPNSAEFAVVFNIILWLMIGFFLAVLAAAYSMWFMDPGKDNIVYRVTGTRMKSD